MTTPATPQRPFTLTYSGEGIPPQGVQSEQLSPADLDRLWRVGFGFFGIPPFLQAGPGPRRDLTLTAPNGTHTVAWTGFPPPQVAELVATVEELSRRSGSGGAGVAGGSGGKSRKGLWLGVGAGALVVAGVVVALIFLLGGGSDPKPAVPSALQATAGKGQVSLSWAASKDATRYQVLRDDKPVATVTTTSYTDSLPNEDSSDTHRYAIVALSKKDKASAPSAVVSKAPELRGLNGAETAFIAKLPRAFTEVGSCKPEPAMEVANSVDVAVRCEVSDAAVTSGTDKPSGGFVAFHAISRDAYTQLYNKQIKGLQQTRFTCETGLPAAGNWHNSKQVDLGKIWCTTTGSSVSEGAPLLGWTTLDANAFIVTYGSDGDGADGIESLITFWNKTPYVSVTP